MPLASPSLHLLVQKVLSKLPSSPLSNNYPLANPPPRTLSPEYQRAQEEYLRRQNCDPIFGISSQKDPSDEMMN